jgi:HK97 family phage prohead protease
MPETRFQWSNNSRNIYGFRLETSGVDLSQFEKNPVMLHNHSQSMLTGVWKDWKIEDGVLSGVPVFDDGDPEAVKIKGKVDRGILKGASVGYHPLEVQMIDEELVVTKWLLLEVSTTPQPANFDSICIYDAKGLRIDPDNLLQYLTLSVSNPNNNPPTIKKEMTKLALMAAVLKLDSSASEETVLNKIQDICNKLAATETENVDLKKRLDEFEQEAKLNAEKAVNELVADAVRLGKITATESDSWKTLATKSYADAKKALDNMIAHTPASQQLNNNNSGQVAADEKFNNLSFKQLKATTEGSEFLKNLSVTNPSLYEKKRSTPNAVVTS